nr:glycosyltransferase family 2 protein [Bacteroidota bacterium]
MKIVMTILVRDEEDIIRENILFHLACGVDFFIVMDHKSKDATPTILKEFEAKGLLHYIYEPGEGHHQSERVTRMARMAYTMYNADWVINNDADEFWYPADGNLKNAISTLGNRFNKVAVKRHNFVFVEGCNDPFYKNLIYREAFSRNPTGGTLPPKALHRGDEKVVVCEGNHEVEHISDPLLTRILRRLRIFKKTDVPIEIFHFPYRSVSQIKQKVWHLPHRYQNIPEIGKKIFSLTFEEISQLDGYQTFLKRNTYNHKRLSNALSSGELVKDERFREFYVQKCMVTGNNTF